MTYSVYQTDYNCDSFLYRKTSSLFFSSYKTLDPVPLYRRMVLPYLNEMDINLGSRIVLRVYI